ncbi:MAG: DUF1015 domain-containing protein [SAR202 cluster bacterium]|nr:DUF1015 domain-containing protein [SAR202 cluster bacterium]
MADIRPFTGIRYDPGHIPDLSDVLCPPYDIISPDEERSFLERSMHNAISLELRELKKGEAGDPNRYAAAAGRFQEWLAGGLLRRDTAPSMYLLEERFEHRGAKSVRRSLLAAVRLTPFSEGVVMPHEFTRPGPKADRLALMTAARANFSPLMSLYRDDGGSVAAVLDAVQRGRPTVTARLDGVADYRMWRVVEAEALFRITHAMAAKQVFIADGHHRYETALKYKEDLEAKRGPLPPDAPANFVMMALIAMDDPGLLVLPYHRLLGGLTEKERAALLSGFQKTYDVAGVKVPQGPAEAVAKALEARLAAFDGTSVVAAAYGLETGKAHLMQLRPAELPPNGSPSLEKAEMRILHQKGITPSLGAERESSSISFVHDAAEAIGRVMEGEAQVALLLRALPMDLFVEVVGRGERLPPKSTYFYPKLPTGIVFRSLEGAL